MKTSEPPHARPPALGDTYLWPLTVNGLGSPSAPLSSAFFRSAIDRLCSNNRPARTPHFRFWRYSEKATAAHDVCLAALIRQPHMSRATSELCQKLISESGQTCALTINRIVHDLTVSLGGSISAEHGIGQSNRKILTRCKDPLEREMMSASNVCSIRPIS
jgi:FAD linked oxidases, C-terminal domain